MTVRAYFFSHWKRSLGHLLGQDSDGVQPRRAESKAPPRQKFPVEGHAALWSSGSNSPLTNRGTGTEGGADLVRAGWKILDRQGR